MQLNSILEENGIKSVSQRTKISEDNLKSLANKNFDVIKKIKTLGFISIIEREYNVNLTPLREKAKEYYGDAREDQSLALSLSIEEEKKGKSIFFILVVLLLLGYASWYFFTQFDKKMLSNMIPFMDEDTLESFVGDKKVINDDIKDLSIGNATIAHDLMELVPDVNNAHSKTKIKENKRRDSQVYMDKNSADASQILVREIVSIVPVNRLQFTLINTDTHLEENFSIFGAYRLDVTKHGWLVSTSGESFLLQDGNETKEFNDEKKHYFKVDSSGVKNLSESDYARLAK